MTKGKRRLLEVKMVMVVELTNIFSTKFVVETVDSNNGLKYVQVFNNMDKKGKPKITKFLANHTLKSLSSLILRDLV